MYLWRDRSRIVQLFAMKTGQLDVLLGLQWGDEGKGKVVDYLSSQYDIVARYQGGPNAGHTVVVDGKNVVLHTIPSGIFHEEVKNLIGNGVVVDPITLQHEFEMLHQLGIDAKERVYLSRRVHLILPTHRWLDLASESAKKKNKIGSTLRGIGPTYMDKTGRNGIRVGDLFTKGFEEQYQNLKAKHLRLLEMYPPVDFPLEEEEEKWWNAIDFVRTLQIVDGEQWVWQALEYNARILAEGAQGAMLDLDYGTYPYVTSSYTGSAGVCIGLGVPPSYVDDVIGIAKAYTTRVGAGPFPTEIEGEMAEYLREKGHEYGATTGRPRRCGWLDLVQLRFSARLNGVKRIILTKLDVLDELEEIPYAKAYKVDNTISTSMPYRLDAKPIQPVYITTEGWRTSLGNIASWEDLPGEVLDYVELIQHSVEVPIHAVSVGPERHQLIPRY